MSQLRSVHGLYFSAAAAGVADALDAAGTWFIPFGQCGRCVGACFILTPNPNPDPNLPSSVRVEAFMRCGAKP